MATGIGNLPYTMPPVSPFDVITSQAENEKIANIESLADGTGIGDGAVTLPAINGGTTAGVLTTDASGNVSVWGAFSGCAVTQTTAQTLANESFVAITYNNELYDTDSYHSTSSNTSRLTVPATGYYRLTATVGFTSNVTGSRLVNFRKNGTATDRLGYATVHTNSSTTQTNITTTVTLALTAGDYVEVFAYQGSGGALDTIAESNNNGASRFTIERLA